MNPLKLVSFTFLCTFSLCVEAFHLNVSAIRKDTVNLIFGKRSLALDSLAATIYTWDDTGDHERTMYQVDPYDDAATPTATITHDVMEILRRDSEKVATLARLAVAHCNDSSLTLESIHDVYVTNVHNTHIEISVSVCDDESCVTVLVPVEFLNPCNSSDGSDMTSCVLDNILNLDELALQAALKNLNDKVYLDDYILNEFRNQANIYYPNWWIHAYETNPYTSLSLHSATQGFHDMKALLNKDNFKDEINHFAQKLLLRDGHPKIMRPIQSRVTAVGPAGLCLRSLVVNQMATSKEVSIVDVSHRFNTSVSDAESLRLSVLAALN